MTPKVRYTTAPGMTYFVQTWCNGPKCSLQQLTHGGDGWSCDNCGTSWTEPEGAPMDAEEMWLEEDLDGLPVYDEDGNEVKT